MSHHEVNITVHCCRQFCRANDEHVICPHAIWSITRCVSVYVRLYVCVCLYAWVGALVYVFECVEGMTHLLVRETQSI